MSYLSDLSYQILTPAMVEVPILVEKPIKKSNSLNRQFKYTHYDEELNRYESAIIKMINKNKNKIIEYFLILIVIIYVIVILYGIVTI